MDATKFEKAKQIQAKIKRIEELINQFEIQNPEKDIIIPVRNSNGTRNSSGVYISEIGMWVEQDKELLKNHSEKFYDFMISALQKRIESLKMEFHKL